MSSYKVEICLKKKNPPRAQIFRYFRIEVGTKTYCKSTRESLFTEHGFNNGIQ